MLVGRKKNRLIEGFVTTTGYSRKHAIHLLNKSADATQKDSRSKLPKYDEKFRQVLQSLWYTANQICSKRFVPFIPELVSSLERHGHLHIPEEIRNKLFAVSCSTVDRLLKQEREIHQRTICTTRAGSLLKKHINVRTFADWNDMVPGFFEADLVAHCGGNVSGNYLNTLVLTDIETTWVECIPLLNKTSDNVIAGLNLLEELVPFSVLGIDTDNGSEFINYDLLNFCEERKITFTRSRAYKKNDQAHVEQKNGSVVRRLVGHERFEGYPSWKILSELYSVLRLYINYFQPTLKLVSKERSNGKTVKTYDKAKTPYQRIIQSNHIDPDTKRQMEQQYNKLDPIYLIKKVENLQNLLWSKSIMCKPFDVNKESAVEDKNVSQSVNDNLSANLDEKKQPPPNIRANRQYQSENISAHKKMRDWRTRKDPFENIQNAIRIRLELNPLINTKELLSELMSVHPNEINQGHLRTLQRRMVKWCKASNIQENMLREIMLSEVD